jgi:formylmethanofuran dehydrogenase subunit E
MNRKQTHGNALATFEQTVTFHGHACPGLALGYRVAVAAMDCLGVSRPEDEDLVAVVENDACSVDAVQFVCGCTFGKGNLIFRDHGKQAYTFFNRRTGEGIRIYAEPPEMNESETDVLAGETDRTTDPQAQLDAERKGRVRWLLSIPEADLLRIREVQEPPPSRARIHDSSRCAACGERMMETRGRDVAGVTVCIPCAERDFGPFVQASGMSR